jgi:hypothetical protein
MVAFFFNYAFVFAILLLVASVVVWRFIDRSKLGEKAAGVIATFASTFLGITFGLLSQQYHNVTENALSASQYDQFFESINVEFSIAEYGNLSEPLKTQLRTGRSSDIDLLSYLYLRKVNLITVNKVSDVAAISPFKDVLFENPEFRFYLLSDQIDANNQATLIQPYRAQRAK